MSSDNGHPQAPPVQDLRKRGQELLTEAQPYLAQAKQQATRAFSEHQVPLYQRVLGMTTAIEVERTAVTASLIAAMNKTDLSDAQVRAIAEHTRALAYSRASVKWCEIIACAGLAFYRRGAKMHPFFLTNRWMTRVGHFARFCMYYLGTGLFIDTPLQLSANLRHSEQIKRDPRLAGLTIDRSSPQIVERRDGQLESYTPNDAGIAKQAAPAWASESSSTPGFQGSYQDNSIYAQSDSQQPSYKASPPQSYPSYNSSQYTPPSRPQRQPESVWDSDPTPSFDDGASPVAPAARNQAEYSQGTSSWAQIRQQSSEQSTPSQERDSWGSERSSSGSSWGGNNSPTPAWGSQSPESGEKSQAQREFDSLVERERRGADQTQSAWGRR